MYLALSKFKVKEVGQFFFFGRSYNLVSDRETYMLNVATLIDNKYCLL